MLRLMPRLLPGLLVVLLTLAAPLAVAEGIAVRIEIKGAIGPATSDHLIKAIDYANEIGARLVIIEMDTPGGLDSAMRDMIKAILNSEVPVATYVAPSGSRAASAGTYILYASHIAAMAPATNLGAATPVQIAKNATRPLTALASTLAGSGRDEGGSGRTFAYQSFLFPGLRVRWAAGGWRGRWRGRWRG